MEHVTFIVMESGCDRVSIVTADVGDVVGDDPERESYLASERGFFETMKKAVTRWATTTPSGKRAVDETHGQLTIETIQPYIDLPLRLMLAAEGIVCLSCVAAAASTSGEWHLTDLLFDKEETHE